MEFRHTVGALAASWALIAACDGGQYPMGDELITADALAAHTRFLAGDLLEGRGPGTPGSEIAARYVARHFQLSGLRPAAEGSSYYQRIALARVSPETELAFRAPGGAQLGPEAGADYVTWSSDPVDSLRLSGELVFAGYGILDPERGRSDYGEIEPAGKIMLLLTGEPEGEREGDGRTPSYAGSWRYKLGEARRRGAAGALLIHRETASAYLWREVRTLWGEGLTAPVRAGVTDTAMILGWLTVQTARRLAAMAALDFRTLVESAESREFRPIPTGITARATIRNEVMPIRTVNVAALVRGQDPRLRDEYVIYVAHFEGLGIRASETGDSIYNGAYDNASGTAALLVLADAFAALREPPRRSVLFLAVAGGEPERSGSRRYIENPLVSPERTVAAINLDRVNLWGRTQDVSAPAAHFSSLEVEVEEIAEVEGLRVLPEASPGAGYAFESDQVSFLQVGIPAVQILHGLEYLDRPAGWGRRHWERYRTERLYTPGDELTGASDFTGAVQQVRVAFRLGLRLANREGGRPDARRGMVGPAGRGARSGAEDSASRKP